MASTLTIKKKRTPGKAQATEVESVKPKATKNKTTRKKPAVKPKKTTKTIQAKDKPKKEPIKIPRKRTPQEEEYIKAMQEVLPDEGTTLTEKQIVFCQYYSGTIGDCYGNATTSYMRAYGCTWVTADAVSYRLLGNVGIIRYITKLRGERLSPEAVDAECAKVLFQDYDLAAKNRAIDRMDRIQGRIKSPDSGMAPVLHEFYMGIVNAVEKSRLKELPQEKERVVIEQ